MEKLQPYFIVQMVFILGKKCLFLGNFDTTVVKICISRPLGMMPKRYLINKAKNHCIEIKF